LHSNLNWEEMSNRKKWNLNGIMILNKEICKKYYLNEIVI
jgi:hypothetical protein